MSGFKLICKNKRFDPDFWHKYSVCTYPKAINTVWVNPEQTIGLKSGANPNLSLNYQNCLRILDNILTSSVSESCLSARTPFPDQVWIGAGFDPYCLQEKRDRFIRRTLEIIAKHECSVFIATRNTLALRDSDLIQEIHEISQATVAIACSSLHIKTLRSVEPRATSLKNRKLIIKRLQRARIQTGLMVTPLIIGLNDSTTELEKIFRWSAENNLDFILFPDLSTKLTGKRKNRADLVRKDPDNLGDASVEQRIFELSRRYEIPLRIGRFYPSDFRKENYRLAAELADLAFYRRLCRLPFRAFFKVAYKINSLNSDVRNLIRQDMLFNQPWMEKSVLPHINAFLAGETVQNMIKLYIGGSGSSRNHG